MGLGRAHLDVVYGIDQALAIGRGGATARSAPSAGVTSGAAASLSLSVAAGNAEELKLDSHERAGCRRVLGTG